MAETEPTAAAQPRCQICGEPMPPGEEMFKYHGRTGPCPKPPSTSVPPETTARSEMLTRMSLDGLEELSQTIRISLDHADKTAEGLRAWLRLVEDELERKAGF